VAVVGNWVVDEDGLLFHAASSRHKLNLPRLNVSTAQEYKLGDKLAPNVIRSSLRVVEVLQKSESATLKSTQLEVGGVLKIIPSSEAQILLDSGKDIEQQIASLQTILKDAKMRGKSFSRIDLRFAKPVVVYQ